MKTTCTEERFYNDVAHHQMTIIADDGVNRNILFRAPHRFYGHFNLITWPGHLCVSGDMGCWVFSRVHDMFRFFRMEATDERYAREHGNTLAINPDYWAEKLDAIDRHGGALEFCPDTFRQKVFDRYREWSQNTSADPDVKRELRRDLENSVLIHCDSEHDAYRAAYEFDFQEGRHRFMLEDFGATDRFSFRYIWACYAIVWGIWHYDDRHTYIDFWQRAEAA